MILRVKMELNTLLVSFSVCFVSRYIYYASSENMKLDLIHVIFRHGARTPSILEATHINVTDSTIYDPEGFYQLTNEGKSQAYTLGSLIRKRNDKFLSSYKPTDVYALSSKHTTTEMSMQLVLAGLYPPSPENKWNHKLNWMPIPYYQMTETLDPLFLPLLYPNFKELYEKEMIDSEYYQEQISHYTDYFMFMEEITGIRYKSNIVVHAGATYYAIKLHRHLNLPLPRWCTDKVLNVSGELFSFGIDSMSSTQKLKRLNGGTLIRRFLEDIKENNIASKPRKIYLYSGHDVTLAAFTKAQNITSFDIPPFGSAVVVEKYRDDRNIEYIKVLAWNGSDKNFIQLRIAHCEEFCPMDEYLKIIEGVIPSDEDLNFLTSVDYTINQNISSNHNALLDK